MNEYHFDFGNSNKGVIGMCAKVWANSKKEAAEKLRAAMPDDVSVNPEGKAKDVIYIEIYLNPNAIKPHHIDEWEEHVDRKD